MNSFLRRTVPAALLAGGALMVATAGAAGAQVPMPDGEALPVPPPALCSGPLAAISALSEVCGTGSQVTPQEAVAVDGAQVGSVNESITDADQVQPRSMAQVEPLAAAQAPDPDPCDAGDCEPDDDSPCDECEPEVTVPVTETTAAPETTTTAPPTTEMPAAPVAQELPRTGSTVSTFAVAGAALLALGAALVATKRFALGRR
jgi:LPXTG-motif cell wall-anchored protein